MRRRARLFPAMIVMVAACDPAETTGPCVDQDADGVCEGSDVCPGFDDTADADRDGVPDGCDLCPDAADEPDADGDGVPDGCDRCPGVADGPDTDGDGAPDGCDPCPLDRPDDTDGDGVCNTDDICYGHDDTIDSDRDGAPDGCDLCPAFDDNVDADADGLPDQCDECPQDADNDIDGDAFCANVDNCPNDYNPGQGDDDADNAGDVCDACLGFDDAADADMDGAPDYCDLCPGEDDRNDEDADGLPDACDDQPGSSDWMRVATIGGAGLYWDISDSLLDATLDGLVDENVSVVEGDADLSLYLDELQFQREMNLVARTATRAHERGLKVVWYYPAMESITQNGRNISSTMAKDHPEWVQLSIDGSPNVFYGDVVFWVDPDDESAWLDPLTGYRDFFLGRIEQLAATGVDGVWIDVPLYNDIVGDWTSHRTEDQVQFYLDTGFDLPGVADASDPTWWLWIQWRHQIIDDFLKQIHARARTINPAFNTVVETVTLDYNAALIEGLDGTFAGPLDGYWHVWEVDSTSETNAMVNSGPDDWMSLIAMFKFARGADRGRACWSFVYGLEVDDAEAVMAEALAAQNNPYELKTPEMCTTVGGSYRERVFGWVRRHADALFRSTSLADIAVIHSSPSRDFVDGTCMLEETCGMGLYATWQTPNSDPEFTWWTDSPADSIHSSFYLAEYKGMVKALVHLHQPFDVIPSRLMTDSMLSAYQLLVVPDLEAVSDSEAALINTYVQNGGSVLLTGAGAGTRTETAALRATNAFSALRASASADACADKTYGSGSARYCNYLPGKRYFDSTNASALADIDHAVQAYTTQRIVTTAPPATHFELYQRRNRWLLHIVNSVGADGTFSVSPQTFHVAVDVSSLGQVESVYETSPRMSQPEALTVTRDGDMLEFDIDVDIYKVVMIDGA